MRRRTFRSAVVLGAAAAAVSGLLPVLPATSAVAAPAAHADDFNGDGYRDYAAHLGWSDQAGGAGAVRITFGTASGPGTRTQVIHQQSPGVPGENESDDRFGEVRAAADFNRDGYADLAVASPGERIADRTQQGWVQVLWGSSTGLSGGTSIPNREPMAWGTFGEDLAAGDFNGDGRPDLAAINGSETWVYRGRITTSGVLGSVTRHDRYLDGASFWAERLIAGKVNRDASTDLVIIGATAYDGGDHSVTDAWYVHGGSRLRSGPALRIDHDQRATGNDGVIADFNRDGYGDTAIGSFGWADWQGKVSLWYGGSGGPSTATRLTQGTAHVAGTPEAGDGFGYSVSAGDVNGDGYQDLAVSAYCEDIGPYEDVGFVHLFRGGSNGLTGARSTSFERSTPGVPGTTQSYDGFGSHVRLRDTNRDGYADLYIAADLNDPSVRLPGSAGGITTTGATELADHLAVDGILQ
ncbi:FG-GAP and VCBS repeat-containing protein [Streptomyces litchfieldiae]|uniref:FG-GAP and VCBS repeat-containing protein n=1 Tax=Streptomyces litchfieldiae TaxID=3075543 RepID=A0ABU2MPX0_9ACTN|nr:FG-GAP and VCBS repeat-containing protein [Streptomyces sp. DSM 44938]MDT0343139.1 FG-GAP and VCBS repeat-containing protein [Streptomyces sp. DSM 44938]